MIPNLITISRIFAAFFAYFFIQNDLYFFAYIVVLFGIVSDFLDGFLARTWNMADSFLGKALDPVADKIFIILLYLALYEKNLVPLFVLLLFVSRDIFLVVGWCILSVLYHRIKIKPSMISKINTCLQFLYPIMILNHMFLGFEIFQNLTKLVMWGAVLTTILSSVGYMYDAKNNLYLRN